MTVTFCGHRQTSGQEKISNWLDIILPALIEGGAKYFYLGGYGDFDNLAAAAVRRQKNIYSHIQTILLKPLSRGNVRFWPLSIQINIVKIIKLLRNPLTLWLYGDKEQSQINIISWHSVVQTPTFQRN